MTNVSIWKTGIRRLSLLKFPINFSNVMECPPGTTIWSTHFEIKMYNVRMVQQSEFDRYLYVWFKIRRYTDKRNLYLHVAYEKGLYYMSMRFLTTSMKRHYLILMYKKYVEGESMDTLYEAIPKCWVPPDMREMHSVQDMIASHIPKQALEGPSHSETCSRTVDVAVQTESQNSNSGLVGVAGSPKTYSLQAEISTVSVESAKPSESCALQAEISTCKVC